MKMYTWNVTWIDYDGSSTMKNFSVVSTNLQTAAKRAMVAARRLSGGRNPLIISMTRNGEVHL